MSPLKILLFATIAYLVLGRRRLPLLFRGFTGGVQGFREGMSEPEIRDVTPKNQNSRV